MKKPIIKAVVPFDVADAAAVQALLRGEAEDHQQKRALDWIIQVAAGAYQMPFVEGGEDGRRKTDFNLGRMFVGQEIVKLLKVDLAEMRRKEHGNAR